MNIWRGYALTSLGSGCTVRIGYRPTCLLLGASKQYRLLLLSATFVRFKLTSRDCRWRMRMSNNSRSWSSSWPTISRTALTDSHSNSCSSSPASSCIAIWMTSSRKPTIAISSTKDDFPSSLKRFGTNTLDRTSNYSRS